MARNVAKTAGQRLVSELSKSADPYEITLLIREAGRIADRLDVLDELLTGKRSAWMHVRINRDQVLQVVINDALKEATALTMALSRLIGVIHKQRASIPGPDPNDDLANL
jgi:hypothetical protein